MAADINASPFIKDTLKKFGLTQMELARIMGVSQQSVAAYANGTRYMSATKKAEYDSLFSVSKSAMRLKLEQLTARAAKLDGRRAMKWDSRDAFADANGLSRKLVSMGLQGYRMDPDFEETLEKALGPDLPCSVGELFGHDPDIKEMLREISGKLDSLLQIVGHSN